MVVVVVHRVGTAARSGLAGAGPGALGSSVDVLTRTVIDSCAPVVRRRPRLRRTTSWLP